MGTKKTTAAAASPETAPEAQSAIEPSAPSIEEAREMFAENPGLSSVVTTDGRLSRDGILEPALVGK